MGNTTAKPNKQEISTDKTGEISMAEKKNQLTQLEEQLTQLEPEITRLKAEITRLKAEIAAAETATPAKTATPATPATDAIPATDATPGGKGGSKLKSRQSGGKSVRRHTRRSNRAKHLNKNTKYRKSLN